MKNFWLLLPSLLFFVGQTASQVTQLDTLPHGAWATLEVINGDSTFLMSLPPLRLVAKRKYKDIEEQHQFRRYVWAAQRVYPYAVQAVDLFAQIEEETEGMSKRKRIRHNRREHNELKEDMTERMKNLSVTEGKVLIKMIERELDMPFYQVLKKTRGSATAIYWNTLGKFKGYDLKEGYRHGADPLLDEVFIDYDFGNPLR